MRKSWHVSRTEIKPDGAKNTTGFVKGKYILERANNRVEKSLIREFKKEIEAVNRKHDK